MRLMSQDDEKLALDTERLNVYLTGLQAEVEAKVRRVNRFREQMQKLDAAAGRRNNLEDRERAARSMISGIDEMIDTNLIVRDMLQELREAAAAVLADLTRV
jgi:hypothetical protein